MGIVVDHEHTVAGTPNVQFDSVDAERHGRLKGRDRVLALDGVQSAMGNDGDHPMSLAGEKSNYMDVTSLIHESALVFGPKIR